MSMGKDKPGIPEPDPREVREMARRLERGFAQVHDQADAERVLDEASAQHPSPADSRLEAAAADAAVASAPEEQAALDAAITGAGQAREEEAAAPLDLEVLPPETLPAPFLTPEAIRGRDLLRKALLHRLRPLEAVDTVLFLQVNQLPHPPALDRAMFRFSYAMTGGWAWLLVPLVAGLLGNRERRRHALRTAVAIAPALWIATSLVEYPVKRFFRRKRPFTDVVRAIVVGRRAASFSFPSGHSAAAFAGAVLLHRYFPRQCAAFYGIASLVAFSRVYLGAHYPGDVATGGVLGFALAKLFHGLWLRAARRFIPLLKG